MKLGAERSLLRSAIELRRQLSPAYLRRKAWEDGLLGGDRRWLAAGAVVWSLTLAGRAWRREPEVVYRTVLKPGETITVSTRRPPDKRATKQTPKRGKR